MAFEIPPSADPANLRKESLFLKRLRKYQYRGEERNGREN
jgi:hypothetical protein